MVPSPCAETLGICSAGSVMPKYFKTTRIKELLPAKLVGDQRRDLVSLKQATPLYPVPKNIFKNETLEEAPRTLHGYEYIMVHSRMFPP